MRYLHEPLNELDILLWPDNDIGSVIRWLDKNMWPHPQSRAFFKRPDGLSALVAMDNATVSHDLHKAIHKALALNGFSASWSCEGNKLGIFHPWYRLKRIRRSDE